MKTWTHFQTKHSLPNRFCKLKQQNWHVTCSWHDRTFVTNPTVRFFVSEWLIPMKYPLPNHFSRYYYLILNGEKEVDIIHVSSRSLMLGRLYLEIFWAYWYMYRDRDFNGSIGERTIRQGDRQTDRQTDRPIKVMTLFSCFLMLNNWTEL